MAEDNIGYAMRKDEKEFHDAIAHEYENVNRLRTPYNVAHNLQRVRDLQNLCTKFSSPRILEVGCGVGYTLLPLMEYVRNSHLCAVDISPRMVMESRGRLRNNNCHLIVADAVMLPFKDNVFHMVYCIATLHHLPNQVNLALSEFGRTLMKGGVLYIEEPLEHKLWALVRRLMYRKRPRNLSPHEKSLRLSCLLNGARQIFSVDKYQVLTFLSPLASGVTSTNVAKVMLVLDSMLAKIPFLRSFGLNIRLWGRKL